MTVHQITTNLQYDAAAVRRTTHGGAEHLVVPVVMAIEGVLNDALVLAEELGVFPAAWDGRPVPVLHPEERGLPISANRPDVIERNTIGTVFNTRMDGKRLLAELWLHIAKAEALGYGDLIKDLAAGKVMEVSTGYFAQDEDRPGVYNGKEYKTVHRGIRPDHLALLPTQVGACSVEDGCGTRINKRSSLAMKVNEAWSVLSKALGLTTHCQCEENESMDVLKEAKALVKANMLDAKQLAAIQKMDQSDRDLMAAFISALGATVEEVEEVEEEEMPADAAQQPATAPAVNKAAAVVTQADIAKLVANGVKEHLRRADVVAKLTANSLNALTEAQMADMSVDHLEAVEKMIRPADYSGAGGFASNASAASSASPLRPRSLVLATNKKEP